MARPRKPNALLELTGSFKKDPQRRREEIPDSGPAGEAPVHFTAQLRKIWDELRDMCPPGVLQRTDRWLLEVACRLMLQFRRSNGKRRVTFTGTELSQLVACLSRMGLTPADRSRVGVSTQQETLDELAQLALEARGQRPNGAA